MKPNLRGALVVLCMIFMLLTGLIGLNKIGSGEEWKAAVLMLVLAVVILILTCDFVRDDGKEKKAVAARAAIAARGGYTNPARNKVD